MNAVALSLAKQSRERGLRPAVLAYLMLGAAFEIRDDADDFDAWHRVSDALDRAWYDKLTEYERLTFSYETRVAMAEALDSSKYPPLDEWVKIR